MDNNDFNQIPKPKYINEYKSFKDVISMKRSGDKTYLDKFLIQLFVSLVIAATILMLNNIKINATDYLVNGIKSAISWQVDISEQIKRVGNIKNMIPDGGNLLEGILPSEEPITFIMPLDGEITSSYGERVHPVFKTVKMHNGIDIDAEYGEKIKSSISGKVETIAEDATNGKYLIISTKNIKTIYAHCSKIVVDKNDRIKQGDIIAEVGDTGLTTGPHLHFEIVEDGKSIDPLSKLNEL